MTGGIPAIVDEELWNTCQEIRKKLHRKHTGKHTYLLSGKCYCGTCGSTITCTYASGKNKDQSWKYYYYGCRKKTNQTGGCGAKAVRQEKLEKTVLDFIFNNVLAGSARDAFVDLVIKSMTDLESASPIKGMEAELTNITKKIKNINAAIAEGIWTSETKTMLSDLSERSEELKSKIAYLRLTESNRITKDRIRFIFEKIADGDRDDPDYLRSVIDTLINSITIYPDYLRIVINAAKSTEKIPPEDLPPIDALPDLTNFELRRTDLRQLFTIQNYPVIVFKIAV